MDYLVKKGVKPLKQRELRELANTENNVFEHTCDGCGHVNEMIVDENDTLSYDRSGCECCDVHISIYLHRSCEKCGRGFSKEIYDL